MRLDHENTPIYSALQKYINDDITHFDVPGHKKNTDTFLTEAFGEKIVRLDANSTKELDMLSNPQGIIAEAEKLMADAYGADHAFMVVNGSTFGVQAMIMSVCFPGDRIIVPRNVHKSAINGIILSGAIPYFMKMEIDTDYGIANGVTLEAVRMTLNEHPDAKALFLVNPTYFGITSDIKKIVELCHERNVAVLADEAHGAHFPFYREFPMSAIKAGADMSTVSTHKTGGSLTQSSVMLLNEGLVKIDQVRATINLMQTTSASYILLASLDLARRYMVTCGEEFFKDLVGLCIKAKEKINNIPGFFVIDDSYTAKSKAHRVDPTKFVIKVNELGFSGFEIYDMLKDEYNIQCELAEAYVILMIISIGDSNVTLEKLLYALEDISRRFYGKRPPFKAYIEEFFIKPETVIMPREAYYGKKRTVHIKNALGELCGESIMIYPPGIPLIIPGEKITQHVINNYLFYMEQGCILMNDDDYPGQIKILGE